MKDFFSNSEIHNLITFVNSKSNWGCKHDHRLAKVYLRSRGLSGDTLDNALNYIKSRGGACDCELVMNSESIFYDHGFKGIDSTSKAYIATSPDQSNGVMVVSDFANAREYTVELCPIASELRSGDAVDAQYTARSLLSGESEFWEAYIFTVEGKFLTWTTSEI